MTQARTPAKAWQEMLRGNERFVNGEPAHPRQDVERREQLGDGQLLHAQERATRGPRLLVVVGGEGSEEPRQVALRRHEAALEEERGAGFRHVGGSGGH